MARFPILAIDLVTILGVLRGGKYITMPRSSLNVKKTSENGVKSGTLRT
jgi:hypothetical protein